MKVDTPIILNTLGIKSTAGGGGLVDFITVLGLDLVAPATCFVVFMVCGLICVCKVWKLD